MSDDRRTRPRTANGPSRTRRSSAALTAAFLVATVAGVVWPAAPASAAPGDIATVAGPLPDVWGLDETPGGLLVSQSLPGLVSRVSGGVVTPVAGGGVIPSGDGGPATAATIDVPEAVAVDSAGNLFVSERATHRIRRVAAGADGVVTGAPDEVVTTVVGTGTSGFSGDSGPATAAQIFLPDRMAFDAAGNLFLSDEGNRRVRRVDPGGDGVVDGDGDEVITTVAGDGTPGPSGDNGPATAAGMTTRGLAFDAAGRLYIGGGNLVRRVDHGGDGVVTGGGGETVATFAGGGALLPGPTNPGEGAAATAVALDNVYSMAFDSAGNLFFASTGIDVRNHVLRVTPGGTLTTAVGAGVRNGTGDGGPALAAGLDWSYGIAFDSAGNLYVGELTGHRVRKVVPGGDSLITGAGDEVITRVAGTGVPAAGGDGGLAVDAPLNSPAGLWSSTGGLLIVDRENDRVRRIDGAGVINTVAGGGVGDGLPATSARLSEPRAVLDTPDGVLIADCGNDRVRRVDPGGVITTLLGPLPCPSGLHVVETGPDAGTLYVAVAGGHRVLKRTPGGIVTTVAGTGISGFDGDGGAATSARLNGPAGVHLDSSGNLYVADTRNNRVRKVAAGTGQITTVAGDGTALFGILGGVPATSTSVAGPEDMVVDVDGNVLIAETLFSRLRKVTPGGVISTIAGNGIPAFGGDGGPATAAVISSPTQLDLDTAGGLLFTDRGNARVRRIEPGTTPPPPPTITPQCGSVLTANTTLTRDIGPCPGDGLVVGADNITVNLNGFRVLSPPFPNSTVGIRLFGRTGVTVRGGGRANRPGTVSGFDAGVAIIGGSHNTVEGIRASDNYGFDIYGDGIGSFFSSFNVIRDNVVTGNGIYDGIGILGIGTQGNVVQRNTVTQTNADGEIVGAGIGIVLTPFLSEGLPREQSIFDNQILDNVVQNNDNAGISNISNVNGVIRGNTVRNNGRLTDAIPANGIGVQNLRSAPTDTHVTVENNVVIGNGSRDAKGKPSSGDGINITSRENLVVGNRVEQNQFTGISLVASDNEVSGNQVKNNGADGILVTSLRNVVQSNAVTRNGGSGIKAELGALGNRFLNNTTPGNGPRIVDFENQSFQADLVDVNADFQVDPLVITYDCGDNEWSGNTWSKNSFFPDPALSDPAAGIVIDEACTTAAGAAVAVAADATAVRDAPSDTGRAGGKQSTAVTTGEELPRGYRRKD